MQNHTACPGDRVTRVDPKEAQVEKSLTVPQRHAGHEQNRGKTQWGWSQGEHGGRT